MILFSLLAATIGLFIAVLLISKEQDWDADGSEIYIRDSVDDAWPSQLEYSLTGFESFCLFINATDYAVCLNGGFKFMLFEKPSMFQFYNTAPIQKNISNFLIGGHTYSRIVTSTFNQMPSFYFTGNFKSFACETSITGIRDAEAMYLFQLIKDWQVVIASLPYDASKNSIFEYKYFNNLHVTAPFRVPVIRVACSGAQNLSKSSREVDFFIMSGYGCWNSTRIFRYDDLNQTSSKNLRISWVFLSEQFGRVSTELLFEISWVDENSRVVLGCSIDARWANATILCADDVVGSCSSFLTREASGRDLAD